MAAGSSKRVNPAAEIHQRTVRTICLLLAIIVLGTFGFRYFRLDDSSWVDCLYMAVTTLTTVGYGEIVRIGTGGRMFVILYVIGGISIFSFSAFQVGQFLVSAKMQHLMERRRMEKTLQQLNDHFIICGLGRMGLTICEHLSGRGRPFVVIDNSAESVRNECGPRNWLYVAGDATDDNVLMEAGIGRARSMATVLPTDADNVYVVLSARLLSSRIEIIARASGESAATKLKRAGANRVVSPYSTGAHKIARFMLNPNIEDFLEIAALKGQDLELADVQIDARSPYVGKQLTETDFRELGVIIVGIRRKNGDRLMPPPGNAVIAAGDCLFAFGSATSVNRMIGESSRSG